jgi:hypothetical protein
LFDAIGQPVQEFRAHHQGEVTPFRIAERLSGCRHRAIDVDGIRRRHRGPHLLSGRIHNVHPLTGVTSNELATDRHAVPLHLPRLWHRAPCLLVYGLGISMYTSSKTILGDRVFILPACSPRLCEAAGRVCKSDRDVRYY